MTGLSRRVVLGAALAPLLAAPVLAGCQRDDYPPGRLRIASGEQGGVYYTYGQAIASAVHENLPMLRADTMATGASMDNLRYVAGGDAEVGFSLADSAAQAIRGGTPFSGPLPITALARLYENYLHLVVARTGPIGTVTGLRGRRVATGAPGSGTEFLTERLLAVAGLDPARDFVASSLGLNDSAVRLAAGSLDAFFFSSGLPTGAIASLARTLPIRLVELGGFVPALRSRYGPLYTARVVPASTYLLPEAVTTVGVPNYLVVAEDMDQRVAYQLTALLFRRRDRLAETVPEARQLDLGAAIDTYPLPLHPGAVDYYRTAKD